MAEANSPTPSEDRKAWWTAALCVFLVAQALRQWGIDFGLPLVVHMDEWEQATAAKALDLHGQIAGASAWRYPPLLAELISFAGQLGLCEGACHPVDRIPLGRQISAWVSSLAAVGLLLAGRQLGLRPRAAAVGGLLFALLPLATRLGRYATPDILAASLAAGALWVATRTLAEGRRREYLLAAVFIGLAAAAKYNAGVVAGAYLFGAFAYRVRRRHADPRPELANFAAATLWSLAVFLLAVAPAWSSPADLTGGLMMEWEHYARGHLGFDCRSATWEALRYLVAFGLGPLVTLALLWLAYDGRTRSASPTEARPAAAWIVGAALVVYGLLLLRQRIFFARLVAPLLPGLCLMVAVAVQTFADRYRPETRGRVVLALGLVLLVLPLAQSIRQARVLTTPDTRMQAHLWFQSEFLRPQRSAKIAVVPGTARRGLPRDLDLHTVRAEYPLATLRSWGFTHLIYGAGGIDRFAWRPEAYPEHLQPYQRLHAELEASATLVAEFRAEPLPGASHFGDAGRLIHNYALEVWDLSPR